MRGAAPLAALLLVSCTRFGFVGWGDRGTTDIGRVDARGGDFPREDAARSERSPGDGLAGDHGQRDRSSGDSRPAPEGPTSAAFFTRLEAGGYHNCALDSLGLLWCWGTNQNGQVGLGTASLQPSTTMKQITGKTGFTVMSLGELFSCGLVAPGTLWTWGSNFSGELGLGDTKDRGSPTQVGSNTDWSKPAAGRWHTCALRSGVLWCWGRNDLSQLGLGDLELGKPKVTPTQVGAGNDWSTVDAGGTHTCGIRASGALYCWGDHNEGQVGTGISGPTLLQTTPVQIGSANWIGVSLGKIHTCGIQSGGSLWCWGRNLEGQLGSSQPPSMAPSPQPVGNLVDWKQVVAGWFFTCGIRAGGSLWCWGENTYGQIGGAAGANQKIPVQVPGVWDQVTAGMNHTCALRSDRTLWCWGENGWGQLATGDTKARAGLVQVTAP